MCCRVLGGAGRAVLGVVLHVLQRLRAVGRKGDARLEGGCTARSWALSAWHGLPSLTKTGTATRRGEGRASPPYLSRLGRASSCSGGSGDQIFTCVGVRRIRLARCSRSGADRYRCCRKRRSSSRRSALWRRAPAASASCRRPPPPGSPCHCPVTRRPMAPGTLELESWGAAPAASPCTGREEVCQAPAGPCALDPPRALCPVRPAGQPGSLRPDPRPAPHWMELSASPRFPGGKRRGRSRGSGFWFLGFPQGGFVFGGGEVSARLAGYGLRPLSSFSPGETWADF